MTDTQALIGPFLPPLALIARRHRLRTRRHPPRQLTPRRDPTLPVAARGPTTEKSRTPAIASEARRGPHQKGTAMSETSTITVPQAVAPTSPSAVATHTRPATPARTGATASPASSSGVGTSILRLRPAVRPRNSSSPTASKRCRREPTTPRLLTWPASATTSRSGADTTACPDPQAHRGPPEPRHRAR